MIVRYPRGILGYYADTYESQCKIRLCELKQKTRAQGILFKAINVNSAHFSDGRNSRINRVTDHKQKRACGPAPIILDCIIASSDARIASLAILFPPGIVVFRLGGAFSARLQ